MQARLQADKIAPEAVKAVLQVQAYINNHSGLEPSLLNLIWLRASQINGCAWCIATAGRVDPSPHETRPHTS